MKCLLIMWFLACGSRFKKRKKSACLMVLDIADFCWTGFEDSKYG